MTNKCLPRITSLIAITSNPHIARSPTKPKGSKMFVGRKEELSILEAAYESESFQMMVVYGRRLIRKFAENKSNVYFFTALEANAQENLLAFSKAILTSEPRGLDYPHGYPFDYAPTPAPSFNSFEDALTYIFRQSQDEQNILVIDEYPYLAQSSPSISSAKAN